MRSNEISAQIAACEGNITSTKAAADLLEGKICKQQQAKNTYMEQYSDVYEKNLEVIESRKQAVEPFVTTVNNAKAKHHSVYMLVVLRICSILA